jgi:hypothetical protein
MDEQFDQFAKGLAESGMSRRRALKLMGATVGGAVVAFFTPARAIAAPQTCVTCLCGTGRPCNVKSSVCTVVRGFSAEQSCTQACAKKNQNLCGLGESFHCPHGCPS